MSSSPTQNPPTSQTTVNNQQPVTNPPTEKQSSKDAAQTNPTDVTPCNKRKWYAWVLGSLAVVGTIAGFAFLMKARKHNH
jgi:hypothetical protein